MHVELTCVAEMNADPHYDELIEDYRIHKAQSNPGLKAGYLLSQQSRQNYAVLEKVGMLTLFRAMHDDRLIGILALMDIASSSISMLESLYVIHRHRKTGAGNALLAAAKASCRARSIVGIIMSADPGGVMDRKLTRDKKTVISKLFYVDL